MFQGQPQFFYRKTFLQWPLNCNKIKIIKVVKDIQLNNSFILVICDHKECPLSNAKQKKNLKWLKNVGGYGHQAIIKFWKVM